MILLNRLEKFAADNKYFSELQFGFRKRVGCIEASFTILETINHMLERGSKVFSCFLDVCKAFDTVWIDGLLFKLFSELDILHILAPFMYKVYINSLLKVLTDHCCAISINRLSLPSPSFADDISLLASYPSFLETFMNICHAYGKT